MDRNFFETYREAIGNRIGEIFDRRRRELHRLHDWSEDLFDRLRAFCVQGKMIRGGLVLLGHRLFRAEFPDTLLSMAASLEILHSSLLIHDDIMDRDETRRGRATIFHQYRQMAEQRGLDDPRHFGESFGICVGDIGFFIAFGTISSLDLDRDIRTEIQRRWAEEFTSVGLAQMQDVYLGSLSGTVEEEKILSLYRYKTARYTFSLPLTSGATAAGADKETVRQLDELGEHLGIVFQLKDDELDLFGDEGETGKPVGTDLEEGKKTLLSLYLIRLLEEGTGEGGMLTDDERRCLSHILNRGKLSDEVVDQLRAVAVRHGIITRITRRMEELSGRAEALIEALPIDEEQRSTLLSILRYNMERSW
jgi:geranylgeranyl diphosphate synthase type I